jgi:acyl-CoA synthetase (AMP-forming)/AMP-acid ligase II
MSEVTAFLPPWNALSLPGLVRSSGQFRANDIVIQEVGETSSTLDRLPRSLTAGELLTESEHLARQLTTLGARPGDRIAINCLMSVDLMIAIAAAMMIGASPLVLPVTLSAADKKAAIAASRVNGIVCGPDGDDLLLALSTRQIAIETFAIRFVASFGAQPPEGVVSLAGWGEADLAPLPENADMSSTALLSADPVDPSRVHRRTQIQLISEALAFAATTQLRARDTVLQTLSAGSSYSIVTSLIVPLLVKAQCRILTVFSGSQFSAMVRSSPSGSTLVLPAHLESLLSDAERAFDGHVASIVFVHQAGARTRSAATIRINQCRISDATLVGEAASFVLPRNTQGRRIGLPLAWQQPGTRVRADDLPLLVTEVGERGEVALHGYGTALLVDTSKAEKTVIPGRLAGIDGTSFEFLSIDQKAVAAA